MGNLEMGVGGLLRFGDGVTENSRSLNSPDGVIW
jgi:hypothetical protein